MNDRRYARFFYGEFVRDYPHIYDDDAAFAAWMRMLVDAEAMWPARPEVPRFVRPKVLTLLVESGLVRIDGARYRVKGLDAERTRRSNAARVGAAVRWDADRNAPSNAPSNADRNANAMPKSKSKREEESLSNGIDRAKATDARAPIPPGVKATQERLAEVAAVGPVEGSLADHGVVKP